MSLLPSSSRGIWTRAIEDQNFAAILDWFSIYFFGCGIAVLLSIDAVALLGSKTPFESTMRAASGGLMLAATALIAGWLLGLLFGIPRSLSRSQPASGQQAAGSNAPAPGGSSSRPSRTNTNLEDVSDWLSKTVVGLGLASLYQIPGYTWKKSGQIGAQIFPAITGGQGFAFLVVAYFTGGGFWIGYIGTRTLITLLFDGIDRDAYTKVVAESGDPRNLTNRSDHWRNQGRNRRIATGRCATARSTGVCHEHPHRACRLGGGNGKKRRLEQGTDPARRSSKKCTKRSDNKRPSVHCQQGHQVRPATITCRMDVF